MFLLKSIIKCTSLRLRKPAFPEGCDFVGHRLPVEEMMVS